MTLPHSPICSLRVTLALLAVLISRICNAQTITVNDLEIITNVSHQEATEYLTTEKHFEALAPIILYNRTISQFRARTQNNVSEIIIKKEWQDTDRTVHPTISYEVRPKTYANTIIKQLEMATYSLTSKQADVNKSVWLFESAKYIISIYTFSNEKLGASIQIQAK